MNTFAKLLTAAACAASLAALATAADARPRRLSRGEVIVVHPRSFTDSGVVVPVGSKNAYVQEMTHFYMQPYERYSPGILWRPDPGSR